MKRTLQIVVALMIFAAFDASAQWIQSGPIEKSTVFVDWPDDPDTSSSTDHVLVPRAFLKVATGNPGIVVAIFCADVWFGSPPTAEGAMTIELFMDGVIMHPGTTMLAQNIGPQNECATFINKVNAGIHVIDVYWRSLGGEQMFMGYRTLTVLHR